MLQAWVAARAASELPQVALAADAGAASEAALPEAAVRPAIGNQHAVIPLTDCSAKYSCH